MESSCNLRPYFGHECHLFPVLSWAAETSECLEELNAYTSASTHDLVPCFVLTRTHTGTCRSGCYTYRDGLTHLCTKVQKKGVARGRIWLCSPTDGLKMEFSWAPMSELPPPRGIPGNDGFRELPPPLVFPDFAPREHTLERVPEEVEEEKSVEISHEKSYSSHPSAEQESDGPERRRRCPPCFRNCCACTCLIISLFLLILLIVGVSLATSINSSLPQVCVVNLKFAKIEFSRSSSSTTDLTVNADVITALQLTNKNDKTVLYYSPMIANVSSENIDLGHTLIRGFRQDPGNVTSLKMITRVRKSNVYDVDATLLRNKLRYFQAVVDVFLSGEMGLDFWGVRVHIPTVIACEDVNQNDVLQGLKPQCDVRIFSKR